MAKTFFKISRSSLDLPVPFSAVAFPRQVLSTVLFLEKHIEDLPRIAFSIHVTNFHEFLDFGLWLQLAFLHQ
jgi:hypothetical protein